MDFDKIYKDLVMDIIKNGVTELPEGARAVYADGTPATTKFIEGVNFTITPDMGAPLLRSKHVGIKWALTELQWIWQEMSNEVSWLKERGVTIWNEWEQEDGTIGKAYGYALFNKERFIPVYSGDVELAKNRKAGSLIPKVVPKKGGWIAGTHQPYLKLNQVEAVIEQLKSTPNSRRIMTTLWNVEDLYDMSLEPCVWTTHWTVVEGKLNLHVKARSSDVCLGLPFNIIQYHALQLVMANTVGLELGNLYWTSDNAHIYERHLELVEKQVNASIPEEVPKLVLPWKKGTNFFDSPLSDISVINYKHNGKFNYEVAI
ncbi:putative thymidylate synthase [Enterococcus phage vB_EfaH_EF1TV]|nr:putative thymidylate synthase [Enterococcus phage vB_EfaH_EF1TV]